LEDLVMTSAVRRCIVPVAVVLIPGCAGTARAQAGWLPEEFTAIGNHSNADASTTSCIDIRITRSGEGEGLLSVATRIIIDPDDGLVDVEGYDTLPVKLTHVRGRHPI
jgi:hypothetical protein